MKREAGKVEQHAQPVGGHKVTETEQAGKEQSKAAVEHRAHGGEAGGFRDVAAARTALYNVCGAFEQVPQPDRLNFLCMVAQALKPLEARFMQLVLHENITGTAAPLAELEGLANDAARINRLVADRGLLSALHTAADLLPLLRVDNPQAGHSLTHTLVQCTWHASPRAPEGSQDFCAVCQAAFSMATRHPAIGEAERARLRRIHLDLLNKRQPERPTRAEEVPGKSDAPQAAPSTLGAENDAVSAAEADIDHREISSAAILVIEKDAFRKAYQFVMEVVWKNGQRTYCRRTHDQFYDFHLALLDKFPEESKKEHRTIPLLPGKSRLKQAFRRRSTKDLAESRREGIQVYINGLIALPSKISRSTHVVSFFLSCPVCYGLLTDCSKGCVVPAEQLQPLPLPPPQAPVQQSQQVQSMYGMGAQMPLQSYVATPTAASPAHVPAAPAMAPSGHPHPHQQQQQQYQPPVYMHVSSAAPPPQQSMYPTPPFPQSVANPTHAYAQHPHYQQQRYPVYHQQHMTPLQPNPPLHGSGAWVPMSARSSPGTHVDRSPRRRPPRQRRSTAQAVSRTPPLPSGRRATTASLPDHLHRAVSSSSLHSTTSAHPRHHDGDGGGGGRYSHSVFAEGSSAASSTGSPAPRDSTTRLSGTRGHGSGGGGGWDDPAAAPAATTPAATTPATAASATTVAAPTTTTATTTTPPPPPTATTVTTTAFTASASATATAVDGASAARKDSERAGVLASAVQGAAGTEAADATEEAGAAAEKTQDTAVRGARTTATAPAVLSSSRSSASRSSGLVEEGKQAQQVGKPEGQGKGRPKEKKKHNKQQQQQQEGEQKQVQSQQQQKQKQKQKQQTQVCPLCSSADHTALSCRAVTRSREEICAHLEATGIPAQADDTKDVCALMARRFWWLKQYRLHKYAAQFCRHTRAEMEAMSQGRFIALGLTKGASNKLYNKLHPKASAPASMSVSPASSPAASTSSLPSSVPWPDGMEEDEATDAKESVV